MSKKHGADLKRRHGSICVCAVITVLLIYGRKLKELRLKNALLRTSKMDSMFIEAKIELEQKDLDLISPGFWLEYIF